VNAPTTKRFGLHSEQVELIKKVIASHSKVERAVLYGSRAKGNFRAGSDIDLTLHGADLTYADLVQIDCELDDLLLPYTVDLSIYRDIENPDLIRHIQHVGVEFYRREAAL